MEIVFQQSLFYVSEKPISGNSHKIMFKITFFLIAVMAVLNTRINANTFEDSFFSNMRLVVDAYGKKYQKMPENWDSLIESKFLAGEMLENARKYMDVENRYFFPNLPTIFDNGISRERIIIMAKQPGGEGDDTDSFDGKAIMNVSGRFLVVERTDGKIDSGRFPEKLLQIMFEKAGLNLKDHTFASAPQPKREIKRHPSESVRRPGDPANLWEADATRPEKKRGDPKVGINTNQRDGSLPRWKWVIGFLIAFLLALLFLKSRRD